MNRFALVFVALLIAASTWSWPDAAAAQLTLYDDFAGPLIDFSKWYGTTSEAGSGSGNPTTEFAREIVRGQLRVAITQYGLANTDSGSSGSFIRLSVNQNSVAFNTIQAKVTVTAGSAASCPLTNPGASSRSRAQILGSFFNDGTSPAAGDRTGDIIGFIQKVVNTTTGNVIEAGISRCPNPTCINTVTLTFQQFVTTWAPNKAHTLTLTWDKANHQFVYSVKAGLAATETMMLPYTLSDTAPAVLPTRQLGASDSVPNCTSAGGQLQSLMDARFDSVMTAP